MKKLSLLIGALGGGMAGYLFSNKTLREQLAKAKDAEEAAKLLGVHLQKDGKKLAKQIQDFIGSEPVQKNIAKAKKMAQQTYVDAKGELRELLGVESKKAKRAVRNGAGKARKAAAGAVRRVRASVRKIS